MPRECIEYWWRRNKDQWVHSTYQCVDPTAPVSMTQVAVKASLLPITWRPLRESHTGQNIWKEIEPVTYHSYDDVESLHTAIAREKRVRKIEFQSTRRANNASWMQDTVNRNYERQAKLWTSKKVYQTKNKSKNKQREEQSTGNQIRSKLLRWERGAWRTVTSVSVLVCELNI